jgi:redox-sensitive bicupin YhaK (pirin superfamily)
MSDFQSSARIARRIVRRTRGHGHGPITRLMSPSDLGQTLKPFVFLDIFDADESTIHAMGEMPVHPHSGIATVTVFTEGHMRYADPAGGSGKLEYGGVEWMRAGRGVWHGKEMSAGDVPRLQGFQLWLALPPELETGAGREMRTIAGCTRVRRGFGPNPQQAMALPAPPYADRQTRLFVQEVWLA